MLDYNRFLGKKRKLDEVKVMTKRRASRGVMMFFNREKEIEEIKRIVSTEPNLITFVYGPINSGKTELMQRIANELPRNYVTFYINFRGKFIRDYNDFIRVLFKFEKNGKKKILGEIAKESARILRYKGIPVPMSILDLISERKTGEDVFEFLEGYLEEISKRRTPVIIVDELQVIKELKIDGLLIYRLFNFFVRLTKELHLAHVFAVTSDSLFIEKIYSSAMLHGRARYMLVDDFSLETAEAFLRKNGFKSEEIKLTLDFFGGKPVYLVEAIKNKHRLREFCEEMLVLRRRQIKDMIYEECEEMQRKIKNFLEVFKEKDEIKYEKLTKEIKWCIEKNIIFLNPAKESIKPQSKLDLIAIKEIIRG